MLLKYKALLFNLHKLIKLGYTAYLDEIALKKYKLIVRQKSFFPLRYTFKHDVLFMARCRFLITEKSISLNKKIFFFLHQILAILYSWLRLPFTSYSIENCWINSYHFFYKNFFLKYFYSLRHILLFSYSYYLILIMLKKFQIHKY